jgi:hypothetical protein
MPLLIHLSIKLYTQMNLLKTSDENMNLLTQTPRGEAQGMAQFGQVLTTHVAKLHRLQVVPDPFVRVQLRRISGQTFQVKTMGSALSEEVLTDTDVTF